MASHFQNVSKTPRLRLICDPKERFPEKVYDLANDGYLIEWNGSGNAIIVNEKEFEKNVLTCYPGFVQITTMLNLRRLFREYAFNWKIIETTGPTFEFSHPCFVYGQRHMLSEILTRRKSMGNPKGNSFHETVNELQNLTGGGDSTPLTRGRVKSLKNLNKKSGSRKNLEITSFDSDSEPGIFVNDDYCDASNSSSQFESTSEKSVSSFSTEKLLKLFVKNEFSFEEFCVWADRNQQHFDQLVTFNADDNGYQGRFEGTTDSPDRLIPCGRCACCEAYKGAYEVYTENLEGNVSDVMNGFDEAEVKESHEIVSENPENLSEGEKSEDIITL